MHLKVPLFQGTSIKVPWEKLVFKVPSYWRCLEVPGTSTGTSKVPWNWRYLENWGTSIKVPWKKLVFIEGTLVFKVPSYWRYLEVPEGTWNIYRYLEGALKLKVPWKLRYLEVIQGTLRRYKAPWGTLINYKVPSRRLKVLGFTGHVCGVMLIGQGYQSFGSV